MGCLIGLGWIAAFVAFGAGAGFIVNLLFFKPVDLEFTIGFFAAGFGLAGILFWDLAEILMIHLFCRKKKLKVLRVRIFKGHYGVDYLENGEKKYAKWPQQFDRYCDESD